MLLAASMLMVTLNSSALATSAQHCEFPGDVNSDSALNILDVLVVVNAIVGDAACSACCNVNADDEVNLLDVLTMVAAIVNPNTCHCSHGQPAEALLCPDDNAHACASCDEGYALSTTDTPICMLTATLLFKSGFEGGT